MITQQQIKIVHSLLPTRIKNDREAKAELIAQFTEDFKKTSTKDLTWLQANQLIMSLGGTPISANRAFMKFDAKNSKHRAILSLCHQYGWEVYQKGRYIADMHRLAEWLQHKSPVQKPLTEMTSKELSKVITAMENMVETKRIANRK